MKKWNWNNKIKKTAAFFCLLLLSAGCLTGCAGGHKLTVTTGLSGTELFKLGSEECTMPEMMIYLTTFYNRYADTYGEEMWNYDFGGVSLETHVKQTVLSKMHQIKIMNLMAKEKNITLTASEEKQLLAAAADYTDKLGKELSEQEKITKKTSEKVYREYALALKVYETITGAENMEISDDEARAVTVQLITFPTWRVLNGERKKFTEEQKLDVLKDAGEVLKRLKAGEDFEAVALQAGDRTPQTKSYARGDVDAEFEEILFSMDEGDVSSIAETADGYVIAKCIRTMDYEATQANKLVLAGKRKSMAFSDAYREIERNTPAQFNEKLWDKVSLSGEIYRTDADFFAVYDEYMKQ